MKAVVAAFNQEKALVGAFSVITNLRMELFEALVLTVLLLPARAGPLVRASLRPPAAAALAPGHRRGGEHPQQVR